MMDERIDERSCRVAGTWMDHQTGRLVDHDEIVILEQDIERDCLAARCCRLGLGRGDIDPVAGGELAFRFGDDFAAKGDMAVADQCLQARTRKAALSHWSRRAPVASSPATISSNAVPASLSGALIVCRTRRERR